MRWFTTAILAAALAATAMTTADAKPRNHNSAVVTCDQRGCSDWQRHVSNEAQVQGRKAKRQHRRYAASPARAMQIDKPQLYVKPDQPTDKLVTIQEYKRSVCTSSRGSTSLARVIAPLRVKAEEIVRECGAIIVSTDCRGGATPNHRNGLAVDIAMRGNASPACIYAKLKDWPGGVSTDYWSAPGTKHVHFSYSRKHEWGLRFAHRGGKCQAKRVARVKHVAAYQTYADDRNVAPQYAVMDDGSRRGKYKSMRERRKALAMQRHAAMTR